MNDPENFLARWSRRKREIAAGEPEAAAPETRAPATSAPVPADFEAEIAALASPEKTLPDETSSAPAPVFDPASLPSLDSIGADTDIRGFLAPGVPTELAHAALRRVWTADPGIRDFKGLADYDWDFTAPGSMLGFGDLAPGTDVKQMLADVLGELVPDTAVPTSAMSPEVPAATPLEPQVSMVSEPNNDSTPEQTIGDISAESARVEAKQSQDDLLHRDVNAAMHSNILVNDEELSIARRQHGGALPQ
jgi:hypothetical protein